MLHLNIRSEDIRYIKNKQFLTKKNMYLVNTNKCSKLNILKSQTIINSK